MCVVLPLKELSFTSMIVDVDSYRLLNDPKLEYSVDIDPDVIVILYSLTYSTSVLPFVQANSPLDQWYTQNLT